MFAKRLFHQGKRHVRLEERRFAFAEHLVSLKARLLPWGVRLLQRDERPFRLAERHFL
jgi:hypothetical protein